MPESSQEEGPSPNTVGNTFMRQYYHFLAKEPQSLHRFYKTESRWCHGVGSHMEEPIAGQRAINDQILKRGYAGARVDLDAGSIDCQDSLQGGVLVLVTGVMTLRSSPVPKPFVQTFFLAVQPNGYFVLNDCLRFLELPGAAPVEEKQKETPLSPNKNGKKVTTPESPKKEEVVKENKAIKKVKQTPPPSPVKTTVTVASSPVKKTTKTVEKTVEEKTAPVKSESPIKSPVKKVESPKKKVEKVESPKKQEKVVSPKKEEKPVEETPEPPAAPVAAPADPVVPAPAEPAKPKTWAALFGPKSTTTAAVAPTTAAAPTSAPTKPSTPKAAAPTATPAAISPAAGAPAPEKSPKNKANKDKESRPRLYSLFIRDVPSQTRDNDLRDLFKSYGSIAGVNVVSGRNFAFVDYHEEKSMRAALAETAEFKIGDKVLQVTERGERKEGPRSGFRGNDTRGRGRGHGPKGGRGERKERKGDEESTSKGDQRDGPRREKTGNRRGGKVDGAPHSRAD